MIVFNYSFRFAVIDLAAFTTESSLARDAKASSAVASLPAQSPTIIAQRIAIAPWIDRLGTVASIAV